VDPGKSKSDCIPGNTCEAKCILVTSPNSGHWGGEEFTKWRDPVLGVFQFFPLWSLEELLAARHVFGMDDEALIKQRYQEVGGVPRHVFTRLESRFSSVLKRQRKAVHGLSSPHARQIVTGEIETIDDMSTEQPKSATMGYMVKGIGTFDEPIAIIVLDHANTSIIGKFMREWWTTKFANIEQGRLIFEHYARFLMTRDRPKQFIYRKSEKTERIKLEDRENSTGHVELGGCGESKWTNDIVSSALTTPNVVFHSVNATHPLYDFAYTDSKGFHAFQVTTGKKHSASIDAIIALIKKVQKLGRGEKTFLYYLVTAENYVSFVTSPASPTANPQVSAINRGGEKITIYYVMVGDPSQEI